MPELPDVEVFKRYLESTSLHREIAGVRIRDDRVLTVSESTLRRHLSGNELGSPRRHGKLLFVAVDGYLEEEGLGPDPLAERFDLRDFREALEARRGQIKSVLMNQKVIAGLGNIDGYRGGSGC